MIHVLTTFCLFQNYADPVELLLPNLTFTYLFEDVDEPRVNNKTRKHSRQLQNTIAVTQQEFNKNIKAVDTKVNKREFMERET